MSMIKLPAVVFCYMCAISKGFRQEEDIIKEAYRVSGEPVPTNLAESEAPFIFLETLGFVHKSAAGATNMSLRGRNAWNSGIVTVDINEVVDIVERQLLNKYEPPGDNTPEKIEDGDQEDIKPEP